MPRARIKKDISSYDEDVVEQSKPLTEMQEKFCHLYVANPDWPQYKCALEAGYSRGKAGIATGLLKEDKIKKRIIELRQEYAEKEPVTMELHLRRLARIREESMAHKSFATALAAEKARGQIAGFYIERKEVLHGNMDKMTSAEILKEIKKLVGEHPELQVLIDTQPAKPILEVKYEEVDRARSVETSTGEHEDTGTLDKD